jgi:hypothetical protein
MSVLMIAAAATRDTMIHNNSSGTSNSKSVCEASLSLVGCRNVVSEDMSQCDIA